MAPVCPPTRTPIALPLPLPACLCGSPRCCADPRRFLRDGGHRWWAASITPDEPPPSAPRRQLRAVRRGWSRAEGCALEMPSRTGHAFEKPAVRLRSAAASRLTGDRGPLSVPLRVPPASPWSLSSGQSQGQEQRSQDNNKPPFSAAPARSNTAALLFLRVLKHNHSAHTRRHTRPRPLS